MICIVYVSKGSWILNPDNPQDMDFAWKDPIVWIRVHGFDFMLLFEMSFGLSFLEDLQLNGGIGSWNLGFEWF